METREPEKTEKPWGYELLYALTGSYAGKVIFVRRNHRLSLQYHRFKEETMYFQSGRALVETGPEATLLSENILKAGQSLHLPAGTCHRIKALEDTIILEVSTPHLEDVIRLDDDYGRAGK